MKFTNLYVKTSKETPKEAVVISHQLMLRAGMIKQLASGVYTYLPLAQKALKKIKNIVREEMDRAGAQEVFMPVMQPAELWQESGRYNEMGSEMMRFKDRHERDFVLGPTHEEVITSFVKSDITSYKSLPFNLYQIQTKFRDERRPRFGLMRGREFIMKDAYSFHEDEASLDAGFNNMEGAYNKIFERCGLTFRAVEADSGAIGGDGSREFHVLAESGEDEILHCPSCNYAANTEKAESLLDQGTPKAITEAILVETPNIKSIEEVAGFLKVEAKDTVKAMGYKDLNSDKIYIVAIRGDYEVNELKLNNLLSGAELVLLSEVDFSELGLEKGFVGPKDLDREKFVLVTDKSCLSLTNHVGGANKKDYHYKGLAYGRDYEGDILADVREAKAGDTCLKCGQDKLVSHRGIEVGHIFKLGDKYSKALGASFLDNQGKSKNFLMGCYGIGVSRTLAATIEQNHDDYGIIWPLSIAPYLVDIIPANMKDEVQVEAATSIYNELMDKGVEVLLDDRNERIGFKLKDGDLLGFPFKIVCGKGLQEGKVEVKVRKTGETIEVTKEDVVATVEELIAKS